MQVVVFGQLLRWQASPTTLTLAWLLATMPGFLGSLIGERLCRTHPLLQLLICCELLGLLALWRWRFCPRWRTDDTAGLA
ncbi:hypothetical protein [Scandinavium tedordense]|uniref:hypothetical protein n=1 Tax=Scandinavium tedordense TaxID=2926521 RepID=UPI002869EA58|nr:hypothetical protein [Scandinavium tedordense]